MKNKYEIARNDVLSEAIMYAVNTIEEIDKKVYAFSTSSKNKTKKEYIVERIIGALRDKGRSVLFLDFKISNVANDKLVISKQQSCDLVMINYAKKEVVENFLNEHKDNYDYVIIGVPPVTMAAMAIEYVKLAEGTILIEQYGYTKYSEYENSLLNLKQHSVNVLGVITYK